MSVEKDINTSKITAVVPPVYDWLYNHRDVYEFIDKRQWFINLITLGAYRKLVNALLREIPARGRVLQMGATFGSQIEDTAYKVGRYGYYLVIDNHPRQIKRCENKYQYLLNKNGTTTGYAANNKPDIDTRTPSQKLDDEIREKYKRMKNQRLERVFGKSNNLSGKGRWVTIKGNNVYID